MPEMKRVKDETEILKVAELAEEIFHKFYYPQMPKNHIDFYLATYQSTEAIKKQVESNHEYYLFYAQNQAVGYLGLEFEKGKVILSKLYVLDDFRNLNIGQHAVDFAKKRTIELNQSTLELFVNVENEKGIKFYKKNGFKEISTIIHAYANNQSETDLLMRATLKKR
jgi:ribosomal protein S18 acetylase RimI-like enzyme